MNTKTKLRRQDLLEGEFHGNLIATFKPDFVVSGTCIAEIKALKTCGMLRERADNADSPLIGAVRPVG